MMKQAFAISVMILGSIYASAASADFTVQIGAMSQVPKAGFTDRASGVAPVSTRISDDGLKLYQVGRYADKDSALMAQKRLLAVGYKDAFVRQIEGSVADYHTHSGTEPKHHDHPHERVADVYDLDSLPSEIRVKVVSLDGQLHVKEGSEFTPLGEYLKR